jgi:Mg2+ and Co2+ transporter CorA
MYTVFYKSLKSKKFQTLPEVRKGAWVHIENATRKDLEQVVTLTGLEYEDVHDSLDIYELPRFERKNGNLLIFIRNPIEDQIHKGLFTETLLIVVSPKYIFTISPQENPLISKLLDSDENFSTTQQYKFLLSILLKVSRAFTKYIRSQN